MRRMKASTPCAVRSLGAASLVIVLVACGQADPPSNDGVSGSGALGGSAGRGSGGATAGSGASGRAGSVSAGAGGGSAAGGTGGSLSSGGFAGSNATGGGGSSAGGGGGQSAGGSSGSSTGGASGSATSGAGGAEPNGGMSAGGSGSPGGSASIAGSSSGGGSGGSAQSTGCGKAPTLKNSTSNSNPSPITISVAGTNREYAIRWPSTYDNTHPYRLILDLHGYGGTYKETAGEDYFGLWSMANDTTIFIALSAIDTDWRTGDNLGYVDAVLKAVEGDLCIDTSRVMLEGFSQGAAQAWQLACARPGVFRAAVGHSGGGVPNPTKCDPIPYLGSGGLQEDVEQTSQTDQFAKWNGCTVTTLPKAPSGGHVCTNYTGCPEADPVRWCNYDGPHTPLPTDSGKGSSWMPSETWPFFSQF